MLTKILFFLLLVFPAFASKDEARKVIVLNTNNTIIFRGPVDGGSITTAQLDLSRLVTKRGKKGYPIYLVLDSPGGSIVAGEAFIQFAKMLPNVHTISLFSASMASAIVEALPGKRYIAENGILMFHRARGSFQGQFEEGEVESQLKLFKVIVRTMEQRNADRLKIDIDSYKEKVKDELWLTSEQSVQQNAADEVVDIICTKDLIDTKIKELQVSLFGALVQTFSGCPLFRAPVATVDEE